jgi:outer membrane protein
VDADRIATAQPVPAELGLQGLRRPGGPAQALPQRRDRGAELWAALHGPAGQLDVQLPQHVLWRRPELQHHPTAPAGAWWDYNEAPIEQAKHEYVARRYDFEANRQTVLDTIATAYYDLAFARENWVVKYYSLELARERLRNTESRIRLGGLAPRDRIADEADVAVKQEDLILAETTILDAEDALRRLILGFTAEDDWDLIFVPTVDLSKGDPKIELPSWRDAAMVARKHRPDVLALMRRVQSAKLSLQQADSDLLPQLDLIAGYSTAAQRDDFGSFNSDIFESEFPSYRVGLEFSIPLGNRIARSRYEAARLDVRRLMTSLSILHIDIIRQVREAIRRLEG